MRNVLVMKSFRREFIQIWCFVGRILRLRFSRKENLGVWKFPCVSLFLCVNLQRLAQSILRQRMLVRACVRIMPDFQIFNGIDSCFLWSFFQFAIVSIFIIPGWPKPALMALCKMFGKTLLRNYMPGVGRALYVRKPVIETNTLIWS